MPTRLIPVQQPLQPPLPTIEGNVDYRRLRDQLLRIDQLLVQSGIEEQFIAASFEDWKARCPFKNIPAKAQRKIQIHSRRALRCNIARTLIMEDFRGFAIRLADSPLLQHFCGLSELDRIQIPSKSTLQRYSQWTDEAAVRSLVNQLNQQAHGHPKKLRLRAPLDLEVCFLDTTCVQANIHYPVDWVLLRDATKTLMKAVSLIRAQGLRHRMEEPALFIRRMNILCMQMTHTWTEAEVEFGNTLLMGESRQGMILDWELFKEVAPNDARLVSRSLKRVEQNLDIHVAAVAADRGFDSESNQQFLEERKTYNGICPRSVK